MGVIRVFRNKPIHTLLFSLYPAISLYASNSSELLLSSIFVPAGLNVLLAAVLFGIFFALVRDVAKAGFMSSLVVTVFFLYDIILGPVVDMLPLQKEGRAAAAFFVACTSLICAAWVGRNDFDFVSITKGLNIVAAVVVVIPLFSIGGYGLSEETAFEEQEINLSLPDAESARPDIYYIMPDRYSGSEALEEFYGFSNERFLAFLREEGFYVANRSRSNYPRTWLSLASSLNMQYLHGKSFEEGEKIAKEPVLRMMRDYAVQEFLRKRGYRYIHFGSWYQHTATNPHADRVVNTQLPALLGHRPADRFHNLLFTKTVAYPIYLALTGREQLRGEGDASPRAYRRSYLRQLRELEEVASMEGPKFVFMHLSLPHYPYVFDRDGTALTQRERSGYNYSYKYVSQVIATNKFLKKALSGIMEEYDGERRPVILLQSDEGPFPSRPTNPTYFTIAPHETEKLRRKTSILNAYYLPNVNSTSLYPSITPVNTFRKVFNHYFDTNLSLLEDRVFTYSNEGKHIRLYEATAEMEEGP